MTGKTVAQFDAPRVSRRYGDLHPVGGDCFCLEPVSDVNDGFNLLERGIEDTGVRVLTLGQTLAGTVRLRIV